MRVFGDVRAGEAGVVLLQMLSLFLLLVAYYVLKTVREPLILATGGAELKSYASAAQAVTLMGFVPLYGWLASKEDRIQLVTWVTLFFIANIELFNLGLRTEMPNLGFVFYVWVGIFSLATIAQFWSFANDLYSRPDGERLFPLIGIGATAGSPIGSEIASRMFSAGLKPADLLHVTVILLAVHLVLYRVVNDRMAHGAGAPRGSQELKGPGGFTLVFRSRYLLLIGALLVLLNVVNTIGEYLISKSVLDAATVAGAGNPAFDRGAFIGSFYGKYFFWVSVAAVVIQALLVSRLVKWFGIAGVLFALPLVSLGAYTLIGLGAAFSVVRWAKTAENSTDYSVMNTARQMLWLPTSREEKYKAKQTLDTFFVRSGDMLAAAVVFIGTGYLGLGIQGFAWVNVVLVAGWLVLASLLVRENRRLVAAKTDVA